MPSHRWYLKSWVWGLASGLLQRLLPDSLCKRAQVFLSTLNLANFLLRYSRDALHFGCSVWARESGGPPSVDGLQFLPSLTIWSCWLGPRGFGVQQHLNSGEPQVAYPCSKIPHSNVLDVREKLRGEMGITVRDSQVCTLQGHQN